MEGLDAGLDPDPANVADLTGSGSATQIVQYIIGHGKCDFEGKKCVQSKTV